jgi:prophage regulatory protein
MKENGNDLGYMRLPEILAMFPVSKSTWWEGVRIQRYPQPVKISPRITAWRKKDVLQLLAKPENSQFPK